MRGKSIPYSTAELEWLEENKALSIKDYWQAFCTKFQRTDVSEKNLHALRKRKGWKTGRTGQFERGQKAWNKDTKGLTSANKTSFKKGNRPHNWKPIGYERITRDGYIEVKTAEPRTFEFKHRLVWKQHKGDIPKGHIVTFIDGDPLNTNINNLELLSRKEHVIRNKMQVNNYPDELKSTIKTVAKIKAKVSERKKGKQPCRAE